MLGAAATLLSAAGLLLVQVVMPNPRGASPPIGGQAPAAAPAAQAPVATGALPSSKPVATDGNAAIERVPIEALAASSAPQESVRPQALTEALAAEAQSADTLTAADRVSEAVPAAPETAEVETVPADTGPAEAGPGEIVSVETVADAPAAEDPAKPAPSEERAEAAPAVEAAPVRQKPIVESERASPVRKEEPRPEPKEPAPVREAPVSPPAAMATQEQRPPQIGQVEGLREAARGAPLPQPARPMTLGGEGRRAQPAKPSGGVSAGAYASKVHGAIARNRKRIAGASGSATVTFAIGPGGAIRAARVSRSSGKTQLDQAALATVRGAGPFPPLPQGAKSTYSIQIYFR